MVATLPRLQWLDGKEVSKSEKILAKQVQTISLKHLALAMDMYISTEYLQRKSPKE